LDLGCGGGWRFFTTIGPVVGLDVSRSSLANAATIYRGVILADACALPFCDEAFDFVVSLDLLGHIPESQKGAALAEMKRVLTPGGSTLHYIEAAADDPLTRWARGQEREFQRFIVRPEGHVGLQAPRLVYRAFRDAGFEPRVEAAVYKGWLYPERLLQYYDNALGHRSLPLRLVVGVCRALMRWPPSRLACRLFVSALYELLDPVLPEDWAGGVLVSYRKPGTASQDSPSRVDTANSLRP